MSVSASVGEEKSTRRWRLGFPHTRTHTSERSEEAMAEVAQKVAGFRQSIDNSVAARELYDLLLKPAESQMAQKSRLIIVPDGPLWDVPFEALQPADEQESLLPQK